MNGEKSSFITTAAAGSTEVLGIAVMNIKWRTLAIAVLLLLQSLFLSPLFSAIHAEHHCEDDGCAICAVIHIVQTRIKTCTISVTAAVQHPRWSFVFSAVQYAYSPMARATPITKKVKLNT
ncbi:MAG: hypothetical protein IJ191_02320 [Treponema sp.]|nr:hypothetical protein [Treponema sp.]